MTIFPSYESNLNTECQCNFEIGSEQALASVREPDTFAEGAWDKLTKQRGRSSSNCHCNFNHVPYKFCQSVLYMLECMLPSFWALSVNNYVSILCSV